MNQISDDRIVFDRSAPVSGVTAPRRRNPLLAFVEFIAFSVIGAAFQGARSDEVQNLMASMNDAQLSALGIDRHDLGSA